MTPKTYGRRPSGLAALTLGATALGLLATGITPAQAQMDTVTVQARAVEQEVRDIPVAITAISEESMDNYGIRNLKDIAAISPSVEINRISSGSGAEISIRGIASSPGSIGIEASVAVIIDGVYYPQSRVIHEGLFDASQVAILKGPQALYFGKNATAGVISITTNDPGDELEILGKVSYEVEAHRWLGEAVLSTPITDKFGIRLAVTGTKMNRGFMQNDAVDSIYTTTDAATFESNSFAAPGPSSSWLPRQEMYGARLTLKGTPNDVFTYRIKGSIVDDKVNNASITEIFECAALNGIAHEVVGGAPSPLPDVNCAKDRITGQSTVPSEVAATSVDLNRFGGENGEQYKSYNITGDFMFDWDNIAWQSILNWHKQDVGWVIDCDQKNFVSCFASEYSEFEVFSVESRAATKWDSALNAVLGVYYQKTKRDWRQEVIFAGAQNTAVTDPANEFIAYDKISGSDGKTWSVYAELIWDITDQLQLTGGARYIWEKKDSFFTQPYVNPFFTGLFVEGRVLADDSAFDDLIPEVTLRYQPNDDLTFWVAYKQGFKSGGFDNGSIDSTLNADPIGDITYQPEHVEGGEFGVKAEFLDNTLKIEFDAYHYNFTDLQLNFFNSDTFAYRTLNAGSAKTTGAEIQIDWAPEAVEGLVLMASLAYNDARYGTFIAPCYSGQTPAQGCPVQAASLKEQDLSGVTRNNAPKWAGKLGFNYNRPFANGLEWGLSGNLKFKSDYLLSSTNSRLSQKSYVQLDAAVRIGDIDGTWQFAIIGRNLTDQYVVLAATGTPSTGGGQGTPTGFESDYYGASLDPRTVEFELSFRF
jgi:outer membrane receptor protein involved in Fe transport